jgi:redox-sensitive bicupin YhaK (pirin superfamily)
LTDRQGRLTLIASRDRREGSIQIHQDVDLYSALLGGGGNTRHALQDGRHAWVQVARGDIQINGTRLHQGDGAAISEEPLIELAAASDAEVLLFDLA